MSYGQIPCNKVYLILSYLSYSIELYYSVNVLSLLLYNTIKSIKHFMPILYTKTCCMFAICMIHFRTANEYN